MDPTPTNKAWLFKDGRYVTRTGDLKLVGPFGPFGDRLQLMGCRVETDGLGEILAWHPTAIINNNTVELTLVNDPLDKS